MDEILPGIFHWQTEHPEIGKPVSSYYLADERVILDPLLPAEGWDWFQEREPEVVLLSNRLHERHSDDFRKRYGCTVWVHETALEQDFDLAGPKTFAFGDSLPRKIQALEMDAICPDDTAFFIPREGGIVAFADGLTRYGGELAFVPDALMEDPEEVKEGLFASLRQLVDAHDFEHLFFAHGQPLIGGGKAALRAFLER